MPLTVLTMVDGLRPDPLTKYASNYPNFTKLMSRGSWTLNASSVMPSITMPCHMSIFHSVLPARHGLTSNTWVPMQKPIPGLVEMVRQASKKCAFFYNWEELRESKSTWEPFVFFFHR